MTYDVKLVGGEVADGSGAPTLRADVGIRGGMICEVGQLDGAPAKETSDCAGKTITPGFIDIHSHADWLLPAADSGARFEPFVRQGITTIVGGNCGFSPAPLSAVNREAFRDASRLMVDEVLEPRWATMGEFLDCLQECGVPVNVAELVGHGTVRAAVAGALNPSAASAAQLREMESLVRAALDAGCAGVSTGLGYPPGIFAQEAELAEFARWAAAAGKLFTSHLRAYSRVSGVYEVDPDSEPHNLRAIREILHVAALGKARLQVSHLIFVGRATWASCGEAIRRIEAARADGLDVAFDAFPYTAGNTTAAVLFPPAVLPRLKEIVKDPAQRGSLKQVAEAAFSALDFGLGDIQIMNANAPSLERYNGLRVTDAAGREGMDPFDFYCRLVVESHRNARVLIHTYSGDAGREEALRAVLRHPLCAIETDALLTRTGYQNPASYGTFPRALGTYVRAGLFSFEEAVRKMTGAVAERLGWKDRGWVRKGCAADLVVVDRQRVCDRATFEEPARFPLGIEHVFINGRHVLDGSRYDAGASAGRVLRA